MQTHVTGMIQGAKPPEGKPAIDTVSPNMIQLPCYVDTGIFSMMLAPLTSSLEMIGYSLWKHTQYGFDWIIAHSILLWKSTQHGYSMAQSCMARLWHGVVLAMIFQFDFLFNHVYTLQTNNGMML